MKIVPVVLCGGAGSRLWPMSRDAMPKQFHALFNDRSLLANTLDRMPAGEHDGVDFSAPCILGSSALEPAFVKAMAGFETPVGQILLEPSIRDTAAAIAAFAAYMEPHARDSFALVVPSDARIDDHVAFRQTVAKAVRTAKEYDAIMLLGITPTRAETQYGYIELGGAMGEGFSVRQFREKPDAATASAYLASGRFLWNAGMFLFRIGRMADEFAARQPEIWRHASAAALKATRDGLMVRLDTESFDAAPKLSIDYAIMEAAENVGVVPAPFDWDDLGSWAQLHDAAQKTKEGNALVGNTVTVRASGNYVRAIDATVAIAGVDDLVVVAEDGKVLVTRRDTTHLVKDVTTGWKSAFGAREARCRGDKKAIADWMRNIALPFWRDHGIDYGYGGVHEALAFDGTPAPLPFKRMRVTARQIYCFAHAHAMGMAPDAEKPLRHMFETLVNTGWHPAEGGFVHLYNPDGTIQDDSRDFYDQCFVLLAMTWLDRVMAWPEARQWGQKLIAWMDTNLADTVNGGLFENPGCKGPRRANPHMHYLEALLAWHETTGDKAWLDRAEKIVALFENVFFDSETGTIVEFFNDDWAPITDGSVRLRAEPGHHFEWAWLLMRYNALRPTPGLEAKARMIFATAAALGRHAETGAVADTMNHDGTGVSDNARLWPQTEALKAAIIFGKAGLSSARALKEEMIDVLFSRYLAKPVAGGWIDAIDAHGKVTARDMPSSSFYHVWCALAEYLDA